VIEMVAFGEWKEAHNEAVRLARMLGREVGILKGKEFGRQVFEVIHLPKAENRYGFELKCEIVTPQDPF
jgi:hypothetical protein